MNNKDFSYYLTMLVIRLKGVKRIFKKSPLKYNKLRNDNALKPSSRFLKKHTSRIITVKETTITEIQKSSFARYLLIYIHGGAFVYGPTQHHWNFIANIAKKTDYDIWFVDYPKAPENNWQVIQDNIFSVYQEALKKFKNNRIVLMGDSAGGTLILNLVQKMISEQGLDKLPHSLFLISPVTDLTLSNPEIISVDEIDPMLSRVGVTEAKQMLNPGQPLDHPSISPLFGPINNLPYSYWYLAENDITFPDQKKMIQRLQNDAIKHKLIIGTDMPHIWPILPVMNASKRALNEIIFQLKEISK